MSEVTSGLQYDLASQDAEMDARDPASVAFWKELRDALQPMTPERPQPGRIPALPKVSPLRYSPGVAKNLEEELFADIAHMVKSDIGSETRGPKMPPTMLAARTPERSRMPSGQPPSKGSPQRASGSSSLFSTAAMVGAGGGEEEDEVGEEVLQEVATELVTPGGVMSWIKDREAELGSARRGLPVLREHEEEPEVCPERHPQQRGMLAAPPECVPEGGDFGVPESDELVERPIVAPVVPALKGVQKQPPKASGAGMWKVVGDSRLAVKRWKNVSAAIDRWVSPGDVLRGDREGNWLKLDGEEGFCLITDGKTIFLRTKSSL